MQQSLDLNRTLVQTVKPKREYNDAPPATEICGRGQIYTAYGQQNVKSAPADCSKSENSRWHQVVAFVVCAMEKETCNSSAVSKQKEQVLEGAQQRPNTGRLDEMEEQFQEGCLYKQEVVDESPTHEGVHIFLMVYYNPFPPSNYYLVYSLSLIHIQMCIRDSQHTV